jgi:hypothetical protein
MRCINGAIFVWPEARPISFVMFMYRVSLFEAIRKIKWTHVAVILAASPLDFHNDRGELDPSSTASARHVHNLPCSGATAQPAQAGEKLCGWTAKTIPDKQQTTHDIRQLFSGDQQGIYPYVWDESYHPWRISG